MNLTVFYITNNLDIALIAEKSGVDRVWIDLEVLGKEERQKNINSVKSKHTIDDIKKIAPKLRKAKMMVRVNPINSDSLNEVNQVIETGIDYIMLPMWKTKEEVETFIKYVDRRAKTILLLETKEARDCLDEVLEIPGIDEIHIGLNDLHLSYKLNFMFELLTNGVVEEIVSKIKKKNIPYGFGGISHLGDGMVPAEMIIQEHYRLGSTRAILSRGFCDITKNIEEIEEIFSHNMKELRAYENKVKQLSIEQLVKNQKELVKRVDEVVKIIKEKKNGNQ